MSGDGGNDGAHARWALRYEKLAALLGDPALPGVAPTGWGERSAVARALVGALAEEIELTTTLERRASLASAQIQATSLAIEARRSVLAADLASAAESHERARRAK